MILHCLNIVATAALFIGVCLRMMHTPAPGKCWNCRFQVVMWAACHIVIVVVVGMIFMDNLTSHIREIAPRYVALKAALAVLFLYPWKRKVVGL